MSTGQTAVKPDSDEQYCSSCGEIIKQEAEICPECGVRHKDPPKENDGTGSELSMNAYASIGLVSGAIGFIFFPVVFGPVAAFCGYQVHQHHDEKVGLLIFMFGLLSLGVGMWLGALTWL